MRLHRIALRNFRGVDRAEVTLAADGVTVIEGDNETGKTSLTDAVRLLLDERDSSTKQEIRDAQP
jgi:predicted ATP-dependent endonuclease of OLD family